MVKQVQAVLLGLGIGLAAGVSPGPLLVLVISSTLRGGLRQGVAVAAAPLLSDLVVVAVVVTALGQIPQRALSALGVAGGLVVVIVGAQTTIQGRRATLSVKDGGPAMTLRSTLGRGALVNLLSPHPWISWITVLGPLAVAHWRESPAAAVLLVMGFYLTLIGSKVAIAALVAGGRRHLTDTSYRRAVVIAGVALIGIGILMVSSSDRTFIEQTDYVHSPVPDSSARVNRSSAPCPAETRLERT